MKEVIAVLVIIWLALHFLSGCSTGNPRLDPNYMAYLEAMKNPSKMLEVEAAEGQTIQFSGIKKFIIYGVQTNSIVEYKKPVPLVDFIWLKIK